MNVIKNFFKMIGSIFYSAVSFIVLALYQVFIWLWMAVTSFAACVSAFSVYIILHLILFFGGDAVADLLEYGFFDIRGNWFYLALIIVLVVIPAYFVINVIILNTFLKRPVNTLCTGITKATEAIGCAAFTLVNTAMGMRKEVMKKNKILAFVLGIPALIVHVLRLIINRILKSMKPVTILAIITLVALPIIYRENLVYGFTNMGAEKTKNFIFGVVILGVWLLGSLKKWGEELPALAKDVEYGAMDYKENSIEALVESIEEGRNNGTYFPNRGNYYGEEDTVIKVPPIERGTGNLTSEFFKNK